MREGAIGEIPQRRLTGDRLVDAADVVRPVAPREAHEGGVRGVDEPTIQLEHAVAQGARDALAIRLVAQWTYPLRRGQR